LGGNIYVNGLRDVSGRRQPERGRGKFLVAPSTVIDHLPAAMFGKGPISPTALGDSLVVGFNRMHVTDHFIPTRASAGDMEVQVLR